MTVTPDELNGKLIQMQRARARELCMRIEELTWVLSYGGQDFDGRIKARLALYRTKLALAQEYGD